MPAIMSRPAVAAADLAAQRAQRLTLAAIDRVFGPVEPHDFGFRLWDGERWGAQNGSCTIELTWPGALRAMLLPPTELTIGEAYLRGDFDVSGSMERAFGAGMAAAALPRTAGELAWVALALARLPSRADACSPEGCGPLEGPEHSKGRDRAAIRYHYDVGNDFYALWLDRDMAYSCAYFADAAVTLDDAQQAKFEHICRKLRLEPGDRVLDIGCGWGGLLRYAARTRGVTGVGITLSDEQVKLANERACEEGLEGSVSYRATDYRDAAELGPFDKIVSVGMFEHVGRAELPGYFAQALDLLPPGGLFLNHGIATAALDSRMRHNSFLQRYVFPDGELEAISEVLHAAEEAGFEVRDVESLREHYALTLRHWVDRLERHADAARRIAGETRYRIWRLYMSGSAHNFRTGGINVYQTLLVKPTGDVSGLPLTRAHIYA